MPFPNIIRLAPIGPVSAEIRIPGSKSITNRAFVIAALADGLSILNAPLLSDDTEVMSKCLTDLGISIDILPEDRTIIAGSGGEFVCPSSALFAGNSGTTIRFLAAAASLAPQGCSVILDGIARMRQRPIVGLIDAMQQLGVTAAASATGCPPVTVDGGGIRGGACLIEGTMSSQYLSALLMVSPYAAEDVEIEVHGDLVSKPYVDMTLSMMADFGVTATNNNYRSFTIPAGQRYLGREYDVEPDASNASYFFSAAAVTGGLVTVEGLGTLSMQGDIHVVDVLEQMGCSVLREASSTTVSGPSELKPIDFDASSIPDMAQTIAVVAAFAAGPSRLTGLKTLRVKETDRIAAMAKELRKIGSTVTEGSDYLIIQPGLTKAAAIDTYDDHRMAMSFAVAGLKIDDLIINDPGCVSKTFPDFWTRWSGAFPNTLLDEANV